MKVLRSLRAAAPALCQGAAALLLLAFLAAVALVPDEAVFRGKLFWSRGLLLFAAAVALLGQGLAGRLAAPRPGLLAAGLAPAGVALAWLAAFTPPSPALAQDEVWRLLLFPLGLWAAGIALVAPGARRLVVAVLGLATVAVAAHALAQNLAGVLELPLDREPRSFATFGNPVMLGAYLVLVLPVLAFDAMFGRTATRWISAIAAGLGLPALLATGTRSAWLGFLVSVLAGVLLLTPSRRHRFALVGGLLAFVAVVSLFRQPDLGRESAHPLIWRDSLAMVADHPLGVGPGQFLVAFPPYASAELLAFYPRRAHTINDVHSEPLAVLVELGWPGLVALLLPLALLLRAMPAVLRRVADRPGDRLLAAGCVAALAGALVQSLVSPDLRFGVSPMLLGVLAGLLVSFDEPAVRTVPSGSLVVVVASLFLAGVAAWTTWSGLRLETLVQPPPPGPAVRPAPSAALAALLTRLEKQAIDRADDWTAHFELGLARGRARDFGRAALAFRRALELYPRNVPALRNLGVCEALSSQHAEALSHLGRYLEVNPRDETARYLRAWSAWHLGELALAFEEVERLLEQNPAHRDARLLLEKLRE